jgi:hypothetical protein
MAMARRMGMALTAISKVHGATRGKFDPTRAATEK